VLLRNLTVAAMLASAAGTATAQAGTAQTPAPRRAAPRTTKPAPPAPPKPAAKPAAPTPPPAPVHRDIHYKTTYTAAGMKTESVAYIKGPRERFEFQEMVLLLQHDEKRTIQISRAANTYLVIPDGTAPGLPGTPAATPAPPKAPGVVVVSTSIVDTGERKPLFGMQARHLKTVIDRQPQPGACDSTKQRIESDGWYIDMPPALASQSQTGPMGQPAAQACIDQVQATFSGDPTLLGYPVAYTMTITGDDGKPVAATMEVVEFEVTTLDQALFEIPPGMTAAANLVDLSKALSDASEVRLAAADAAPPAAPLPKTPGVVRVGVPEFTNKTTQTVDTRGLRQRLLASLTDAKVEAVPMAAAPPADLQKRVADLGYDYLLLAEVSELKAAKPGRIGGLMKAASSVAGGGVTGPAKENTESSIALKLMQPDGKQKLATTTKGKDGSGFSLQTGLGIARFAGGMYMNMFMGPAMMMKMGGLGGANLGGMGLLGNPAVMRAQMGGLGAGGTTGARGVGLDLTASAASYLVQQAMDMSNAGGLVGVPGQGGPSYDESLGEAIDGAAKAVAKALQPK
jgi:hypothetical protein